MFRFKTLAPAFALCSTLAACGSTTPSPAAAKLSLLTFAQEKVLADGVEANVVRDDVDAGVVATLKAS